MAAEFQSPFAQDAPLPLSNPHGGKGLGGGI
jgi:hypothetical protein